MKRSFFDPKPSSSLSADDNDYNNNNNNNVDEEKGTKRIKLVESTVQNKVSNSETIVT